MANLETLELTINANAESASQGLTNLINSLTSLSKKVGKTVGGLKLLNGELAKLKSVSSIKIPGIAFGGTSSDKTIRNIQSQTKAIKAQGEVLKEYKKLGANGFKSWMYGPNPLPTVTRNVGSSKGMISDDDLRKIHPEWFVDYDSAEGKARIAARNAALKKRGDALSIASDPSTLRKLKDTVQSKLISYLNKKADYSGLGAFVNQSLGIGVKPKSAKDSASAFMEHTSLAERAKNAFGSFRDGMKKFGKEVKDVLPKFSSLNRVMRIASNILIRTGVRAVFNGMKEGISNYYQYSKNIGGEFSSVADQLSSAWATLKNQMGAAIAPALSAAIPVINSLASAATTAFNALSQLFALLTGQSSWSKATAQVNAFDSAAKKAGGGGGGLNELLGKFDELNVITSEGGGGGGAAAAAEEYSTMFEEMYEFDEKIRDIANFIKDTITWVKDNFDVLLATAGLIGAAILGWKISSAFEGFISTLGKWIAGGAMISLGVVLSYDFGYKAGSAMAGGDSLNFGDIVEGIAGFIASGIGGYMIGGGIGAGVGIGIAITATIAGIIMGSVNQSDKNKWGNVNLSATEVQEYVNKQFKFDVKAEAKIIDAKITNVRAAKANLNGEIQDFSRSLDKIVLGGVDTVKSIKNAKTSAKKVIDALKKYLDESKGLVEELFKIDPSNVSTQIMSDIESADEQITAYVENEGKKIADLYDQGMKNEWKGNEQEQIYALLSHLESIFEAAEADRAYNKFISESKLKLKDFTKETADAILKAQKESFDSYEKALSDATQEAVESLLYRAKLAEEAGLPDVAAGLRRDADYLVNSFKDRTAAKLDSAKASMKKDWIDTLTEIYQKDIYTWSEKFVGDYATQIGNAFKNGDIAKAKRQLESYLQKVTEVNPIVKEASELFGITGWDLMAEKEKNHLFTQLRKKISSEAAVALLKETLSLSASEIIAISGWDKFANKEQIAFISAIQKAYGSSTALKAAKEAGIDIVNAINEGLSSKDSDTKKAAEQIVKDIQAELDKLGIKIDATAELEVAITALIEYEVKENIKPGTSTKSVTAGSTSSSLKPNTTNISMTKATGAYGIPAGDVFIANEKGAELVGSMSGKTTVANQQQIIEGIASGVERANSEQNTLLRQQNELLRGILEKDNSVRLSASAALGRVTRQSLEMYGSMVGG